MSLAVLNDDQIHGILENLTFHDIHAFRSVMEGALREYSTGTQSPDGTDAVVLQPRRTIVTSPSTGATTLFMPTASPAGVGVKVVTLSSPPTPATGATTTTARTIAPKQGLTTPPTGAITLFAPHGQPLALLHAKTLTAFRTALASCTLLSRRSVVRNIVVFGSGEQAYWHVRLALMLRGSTVRKVHIVSPRYTQSCEKLVERLVRIAQDIKLSEGWGGGDSTPSSPGKGSEKGKENGGGGRVKFDILTPAFADYESLLRSHLRHADVIFCCTPATEPLFDGAILTSHAGRKKGRLIAAIGSYMPHMKELPVEVLLQATGRQRRRSEGGDGPDGTAVDAGADVEGKGGEKKQKKIGRLRRKHAVEGGVVVVDTLDGAMTESGEIREAGIGGDRLVELGEILLLSKPLHTTKPRSSSSSHVSTPSSSPPSRPTTEPTGPLLSFTLSSATTASAATATTTTSSVSTATAQNPGKGSTNSRSSSPVDKLSRFFRRLIRRRQHGTTSSSSAPSTLTATTATVNNPESNQNHQPEKYPEKQDGVSSPDVNNPTEGGEDENEEFTHWLQDGNVVYKSVGLGAMDLAAGLHVVKLAKTKGVGVHVAGF